nr:MAG TPA: hypothetical protein [Caudoviricetes sp.]
MFCIFRLTHLENSYINLLFIFIYIISQQKKILHIFPNQERITDYNNY